jgi:hypothetical protein
VEANCGHGVWIIRRVERELSEGRAAIFDAIATGQLLSARSDWTPRAPSQTSYLEPLPCSCSPLRLSIIVLRHGPLHVIGAPLTLHMLFELDVIGGDGCRIFMYDWIGMEIPMPRGSRMAGKPSL